MNNDQLLSGDQIAEMGVADWRPLIDALQARFRPADFAAGLEFVNAIGAAAEEAGHHPDIDLRYGLVNVRLTSHDVGGKTARDVDLASRISALAAERGIRADPGAVSRIEISVDTWDAGEIRPFWAAVLGMKDDAERDQVTDPEGDVPTIWFQACEPHPEPHQRFHLDLWVPPEVVLGRVSAAIGAGGTLVADDQAPRFTVLADPQGNRVCLCTHVTRSH